MIGKMVAAACCACFIIGGVFYHSFGTVIIGVIAISGVLAIAKMEKDDKKSQIRENIKNLKL